MSIILLFGLLSLSLRQAFEGSIIKYEWGGKRLDLSGKKKMLEEIIHSSQVKTELDHFIATDDRFQLFFNVSKLNWERMISTGAERMEKTLNDVAPNNETHKVVLKIKHMAYVKKWICLELRIVLKYSPERADLFKPDTVRSGKAASTVDREVSRLFRECVHPDAIISVETQRFTRPRGMLRYRMTARAYMTVNRDKLAIGDDELFPLVPEMWFQHKILLHLVQTQNPLIDSIGVRGLRIEDPTQPFRITLCGYLYNAGAPMLFKLHERAKVQEKFKVNIEDAIHSSLLRDAEPRLVYVNTYPVFWIWTGGEVTVEFDRNRLEKFAPLFATSERTVVVVDLINKVLPSISNAIVRNVFTT